MSFVPPIVFDRNAHQVPAPVRLVDMFWAMYVIEGNHTDILGLDCRPSTPHRLLRSLPAPTACP